MLKLLVELAPGFELVMFDGEEFPPLHPVSTAAVNSMLRKAAKPERRLQWKQAFCARSNTQENIDLPLEKMGLQDSEESGRSGLDFGLAHLGRADQRTNGQRATKTYERSIVEHLDTSPETSIPQHHGSICGEED